MSVLRILSCVLDAAAAAPEAARSSAAERIRTDLGEMVKSDELAVGAFPAQAENAAVLDAFLRRANERSRLVATPGSR